MKEKDFNELNEETRARGVKRNSENKIAEVTTSKKSEQKSRQQRPQGQMLRKIYFKRHMKGLKKLKIVRVLRKPPETWLKEI
jgi:hypothetical protein